MAKQPENIMTKSSSAPSNQQSSTPNAHAHDLPTTTAQVVSELTTEDASVDTTHQSRWQWWSLVRLTSLAPRYYAYAYLACLPLFACLYTLLPYVVFNHTDLTFWDNLYFSAVTITTLGYGDITPLNTYTRLFAMAEAILGVVLVGLFLNSVSYSRQEQVKAKIDALEQRKALAMAFSRLRNHDGLIALNMNIYLNRVNQLLGVETNATPADINNPYILPTCRPSNIQLKSTGLWGIYEPMPSPFTFSSLKSLFEASTRLTDDPSKPKVWYYYQAHDDLIASIENLLREADLYRWPKLEMLCANYLIDAKRYSSSSYVLAQPTSEMQLEHIQAQRQRDMQLIGAQDEPVSLAKDNSLNPYIILYMGVKTTLIFIEEFQKRYQEIMLSM